MENILMNIHVLEDKESQATYAAEVFEKVGEKEIDKKGKFFVALSGGKTPALFFKKLRLLRNFAWDKTYIFLVDERFVSINDERSNYKLLEKNLLKYIKTNSFKTVTGSEKNVGFARDNFSKQLNFFFKGKTPSFDLVFLGIGTDGHTASIFSLDDIEKGGNTMVISSKPMHGGIERVSISLTLINNSKKIVFLVSGEDKAEIVKEVFINKNPKYVASHVHLSGEGISLVLDKTSAKHIKG